jgi:hypothetical protein
MARLLNSAEASRFLGLSRNTLRNLVAKGQGPRIAERSAANCYRFEKADLEWWQIHRRIAAMTRDIRPVKHGRIG